jgi:predicted nucleic-acid-binding Zn-ribbon protein
MNSIEIKKYHQKYKKNYRTRDKFLAIEHYSGGTFRCNNCGYDVYEALAIDHALNNGSVHRKEVAKSGHGGSMHHWLVANNFPEGFQVLCFNCNYLKFRHPEIYEEIGASSEGDDMWREKYYMSEK